MSTTANEYKSPERKLIVFFRKSRDGWKSKYKEVKYLARKLSQQVQYLKERKTELKYRVKELEEELENLRAREQGREEEYVLKKKTMDR